METGINPFAKKGENMIYSIITKTKRCLPVILSEAGINLDECEISDYKEFRDGAKSLVLIGDGRKLRPVLDRLVIVNGQSNFDWCYVMGG